VSSLSFTKLFSSITASSIWQESYETRLVWITMLSMADPLGRVNASVPGLAHMSRVPLTDTQKALEIFLAPDQFSRSKDHDGRRIEEITGGWQLLNYKMYRELRDDEIRKEQNRIAQENWRNKNKQNNQSKQSKPKISHDKPQSAQVEVEVEVESTKTTTKTSRGKREADPRHTPFKLACETYATYKRVEFVWDAGEAKQLAMLLAASPGLTLETFQRCLNHRAKSEVAHGDRPREWLGTILKYQEGPLDKYGKPQGAGNGTTQGNHKPNAAVDRQRITHDAILEAGRRRYGFGATEDDGRGAGGQAESDVARGDAGCVPPSMGGDSPEIRFDDFPGRTLEGTP
jgi:hypothetical protein